MFKNKLLIASLFCLPAFVTQAASYSCAPFDGPAYYMEWDHYQLSIWQPGKPNQWLDFSSENGSFNQCEKYMMERHAPANQDNLCFF